MALRLLATGRRVRTLTNSPRRDHAFGTRIEIHPLTWEDPGRLAEALHGADVLYNTYWVRFNHVGFSHTQAVRNTRALFAAARQAGVRRVVHVSITNPSPDSPLEYFRGKAELEQALIETGVSYAILRPAVLFGGQDVLINNIAWLLRTCPVFLLLGDGSYRLRPIHVDDLARLAVEQGMLRQNCIVEAVGPERFTYRELVELLGACIGCRRPMLAVPPAVGYAFARVLGVFLNDVVLTREEIRGLMDGLLDTDSPSAGPTPLSTWARQHARVLGRRYASELARRRNRRRAYDHL